MSLKRYAARRDQNEQAIVKALRQVGADVFQLSAKDVPDLLVGHLGHTYLFEVKTTSGKLSTGQSDFIRYWRGGPVHVVRSADDAYAVLGIE